MPLECSDTGSGTQCGMTEEWCANRNKCVLIGQCSDTGSGTQCGMTEEWCANRNKCVLIGQCTDSQTQCPQGKVQCPSDMTTCVDNLSECLMTGCPMGEIWCEEKDECVSIINGGCTGFEPCPSGQYYCAMYTMCINNTMECIDGGSDHDDYYHTEWTHCGPDQMFCLETMSCVNLDGSCYHDPTDYSEYHWCGDDQVFCLEAQKCVDRETGGCDWHDDDDDYYHSEYTHCPEGTIFCLESMACVSKSCVGLDFEADKGECPVVASRSSDTVGACYTDCESNGDCADGMMCCENECGGPVCKTPDRTEIPLVCLHPDDDYSLYFDYNELPGFNVIGDLDSLSSTAILQASNVTMQPRLQIYNEETDTYNDVGDGYFNTGDYLRLHFAEMDQSTLCVVNGSIVIWNSLGEELRRYPVTFLKFPKNIKPELSLNVGASDVLSVDEDDKAVVYLGEIFNIEDPSPGEDAAVDAMMKIANTVNLYDSMLVGCLEDLAHYLEVSSAVPDKQMFFIQPYPVPQLKENVKVMLSVSDNVDPTKQRILSNIGGVVPRDQILTFAPIPNFHGTLTFKVWALDGHYSYIMDMIQGQLSLSELEFVMEEIMMSPHVSAASQTLTLQVNAINDAPIMDLGMMQIILFSPNALIEKEILPHVPEDINENNGFLVSEVVNKLFRDPDVTEGETGDLGMAIFRAKRDQTVGEWQYSLSDTETWELLELSADTESLTVSEALSQMQNILVNGELPQTCTTTVAAKLLPSTARLRFKPFNDNYWSYDERSKTSFAFTAYESGSDSRTTPYPRDESLCAPVCNQQPCGNSGYISEVIISTYVHRVGCDDRPGSNKVMDNCGECGGDNFCQLSKPDCNGDLDGDAQIDDCGVCYGGLTDQSGPTPRDCTGKCNGDAILIDVPMFDQNVAATQQCFPPTMEAETWVIDRGFCDGLYGSTAKINKCGICVLGNTNLMETEGMDDCGKCDGDNACYDCNDVPYGRAKVDMCGDCKDINDATFNAGCVELVRFSEPSLWAFEAKTIYLMGTQLEQFTSITSCMLVQQVETGTPQEYQVIGEFNIATMPDGKTVKRIMFTTPAQAVPGEYVLRCTLQGSNGQSTEKTSQETLNLYDFPVFDSITPSVYTIGDTTQVTITGSGFLPDEVTVCVQCPSGILKYAIPACLDLSVVRIIDLTRYIPLETTSVTDTTIELSVDAAVIKKPMELTVRVFNYIQMSIAEYESSPTKPVSIQGAQPEITTMTFTDNLCYLHVDFTLNVELMGLSDNACLFADIATDAEFTACCNAIFADSSSLGSGAKCAIKGSQLGIALGSDSTLQTGTTLSITPNVLKEKDVPDSLAVPAAGGSITVPNVQSKPIASLTAPDNIGSCDRLTVFAKVEGSRGCGNALTYTWSIDFENPGDIDINDAGDLAAAQLLETLNTQLAAIDDLQYIIIDGDAVAGGYSYVIRLKVQNFLGIESDAVTHTFNKEADVNPVSVNFASSESTVDPDGVFILTTKIRVSPCAGTKIDSITNSYAVINTGMFNLDEFKGHTVRIDGSKDAFPLQGDREYEFSVTVTFIMADGTVLTLTKLVTVKTKSKNLVPIITGPPDYSAGMSSIITIDARRSYDPNRSDDPMVYTWSCRVLGVGDDVSTCYARVGSETVIVANSMDGNLIEFPADYFEVGDYEFTLMVSADSRTASISVTIRVKADNPPQIVIVWPAVLVNPEVDLGIKAEVCNKAPAIITWTAVDTPGYMLLDLSESTTEVQKHVSPECISVDLVCKKQYLVPGSKYKLQITAQNTDAEGTPILDADGLAVANSIIGEVETAASPTLNSVIVTPTTGTALETEFSMTVDCVGGTKYQFYFQPDDGSDPVKISRKQMEASLNQMLPPGTGRIKVRCYNDFNMYEEMLSDQITVETVQLTADEMTQFVSNAADDPLAALKIAEQMINTGEDNADSQALKEQLDQIKSQVASQELAKITTSDPDSAFENADSSLGMISDDVEPSPELALMITNFLEEFIKLFFDVEGARKKRAVSDDSESEVMTTEQVETFLQGYSIKFAGTDDANVDSTEAAAFFTDVERYIIGLCRGLLVGQEAYVAKHNLAGIRTLLTQFEGVGDDSMEVGCHGDSCPSALSPFSNVMLGQAIEDTYSLWNCSGNTQCNSACIGSVQIPRDLITVTAQVAAPLLSTRRSHLLHVKIVNMETEAVEEVSQLDHNVDLHVSTSGDYNLTAHSFQCRQWKDGDWTSSTCNTTQPETDLGSNATIVCSCNSLLLTSVFEADPIAEEPEEAEDDVTTAATETDTTAQDNANVPDQESSTASSTSSTTRQASNGTNPTQRPTFAPSVTGIDASVTFNNDYDALVAPDKQAFIDKFKTDIASELNINKNRITNVRVTSGSIVIQFEIIQSSGSSDLMAVANDLQNKVTSGALAISAPDGTSLSVITNSLSYEQVEEPEPTKAPKNNNTLYIIIGAVVGGLVLIVIIIVLVVVIMKMKKSKQVEPVTIRPASVKRQHSGESGIGGHYTNTNNGNNLQPQNNGQHQDYRQPTTPDNLYNQDRYTGEKSPNPYQPPEAPVYNDPANGRQHSGLQSGSDRSRPGSRQSNTGMVTSTIGSATPREVEIA